MSKHLCSQCENPEDAAAFSENRKVNSDNNDDYNGDSAEVFCKMEGQLFIFDADGNADDFSKQ